MWSWDEKLEYSQAGVTVFRVLGFSQWYQTHGSTLREAVRNGEEKDLYRVLQSRLLQSVAEPKEVREGLTLRTLLQKGGYAPEQIADIGTFWSRGKRDSYKLYSSSAWTSLRVEYYQKLLDLPVRPTEEEWKIQESEPYFEYLLDHEGPGEKTGAFKLFAHLDHSSDGVLLYDEVPQTDPNFPLHAQAYGYQMDQKGEV